jgi:GT2 family glycosyltransferase
MDDQATTSVVICAYSSERWPLLIESVDSVRAQTRPPLEIIVVIDRNDDLFELARSELEGAEVVRNLGMPGSSGARNTGSEMAKGSVLVYLDDDAIAEPQWLERLITHYASASVLGVGGGVLPDWRYGRPAWFPPEFNWVVGCSWTGLPSMLGEIRNPIGANMSVRKAVYTAVGGFHRDMARTAAGNGALVTGTAEETEFCIRVSRLHPGGRWLYSPDARVHHVVSESRVTWSFFVGRCRMEGDSKAQLTSIAGTERGLESERRYVRSVLPRGVVRELRNTLGGDPDGLRRAGAIVIGFAVTVSAYIRRRVPALLRSGNSGSA